MFVYVSYFAMKICSLINGGCILYKRYLFHNLFFSDICVCFGLCFNELSSLEVLKIDCFCVTLTILCHTLKRLRITLIEKLNEPHLLEIQTMF